MNFMKKGISLIEILAALVILGLLVPAIGGVFVNVYRDWGRQRDSIQSLEAVRWAIEFMSAEIRDSRSKDLTDDAEGSMAEHSLLRLYDPKPLARNIYYWIAAADHTLYRGVGDTFSAADTNKKELAENIISATFNVEENEGDNNEMALVAIELTFRANPSLPEGPGNRNYNLVTRVRPRN
jgi:type II secretory pathway pseudopilin PulG